MTIHAPETVLKHHRHARNIEVVKTYQRQSQRVMRQWVRSENDRRARQHKDSLIMAEDRGVYVVLEVIHGSEK